VGQLTVPRGRQTGQLPARPWRPRPLSARRPARPGRWLARPPAPPAGPARPWGGCGGPRPTRGLGWQHLEVARGLLVAGLLVDEVVQRHVVDVDEDGCDRGLEHLPRHHLAEHDAADRREGALPSAGVLASRASTAPRAPAFSARSSASCCVSSVSSAACAGSRGSTARRAAALAHTASTCGVGQSHSVTASRDATTSLTIVATGAFVSESNVAFLDAQRDGLGGRRLALRADRRGLLRVLLDLHAPEDTAKINAKVVWKVKSEGAARACIHARSLDTWSRHFRCTGTERQGNPACCFAGAPRDERQTTIEKSCRGTKLRPPQSVVHVQRAGRVGMHGMHARGRAQDEHAPTARAVHASPSFRGARPWSGAPPRARKSSAKPGGSTCPTQLRRPRRTRRWSRRCIAGFEGGCT